MNTMLISSFISIFINLSLNYGQSTNYTGWGQRSQGDNYLDLAVLSATTEIYESHQPILSWFSPEYTNFIIFTQEDKPLHVKFEVVSNQDKLAKTIINPFPFQLPLGYKSIASRVISKNSVLHTEFMVLSNGIENEKGSTFSSSPPHVVNILLGSTPVENRQPKNLALTKTSLNLESILSDNKKYMPPVVLNCGGKYCIGVLSEFVYKDYGSGEMLYYGYAYVEYQLNNTGNDNYELKKGMPRILKTLHGSNNPLRVSRYTVQHEYDKNDGALKVSKIILFTEDQIPRKILTFDLAGESEMTSGFYRAVDGTLVYSDNDYMNTLLRGEQTSRIFHQFHFTGSR